MVVVRHDHGYSPAGPTPIGAAAALVPGYALVAVGLVTWAGRGSSRSGPLLAAAGMSWFVVEWNNPGVGWAPAFTLGLIGYAVCPAAVSHAVLAFPNGRLTSSVERLAVAVAYTSYVLVLGVLPTLVFDPGAQGCNQCPRKLAPGGRRAGCAGAGNPRRRRPRTGLVRCTGGCRDPSTSPFDVAATPSEGAGRVGRSRLPRVRGV